MAGPNPKPKKTKVVRGAMQAARTGKVFGDNTQARITTALGRIANDEYSTGDLADDVLGQTSDFVNAVTGFFGTRDGVSTVYLITNGGAATELASLSDSVLAGQIDKTDLAGPVTVTGAGVATAHAILAANYALLHPDTDQPLAAGDEVDAVKVRLTAANVPGQRGIYRGVLALQSTKVIAEVVVVRK